MICAGLTSGEIAGIAIGSIAGIVILSICCCFCVVGAIYAVKNFPED